MSEPYVHVSGRSTEFVGLLSEPCDQEKVDFSGEMFLCAKPLKNHEGKCNRPTSAALLTARVEVKQIELSISCPRRASLTSLSIKIRQI